MELAIALVIGSVLTSAAVQSAAPVLTRTAVRSAAHTFGALHARTRAHAIERGEVARLWIDADNDRIWVAVGSEIVERFDYQETQQVDIQAASAISMLCINPRGFGERGCTSFDESITISFVQGTKSSEVVIWPLGQLDI